MKQKTITTIALLFIASLTYGQFIDRYGVNAGVSYSTQTWEHKQYSIDQENGYKFGVMAFAQAEKDFAKFLSLRTEVGYIQKGFKNNINFTHSDGTAAKTNNDNVVLHNLALNLGLKVKPLETIVSPYLVLGLRSDYMLAYKDITITEPSSGIKNNMFETTIDDFNKFNLGALVSLGIDIKELVYLEVEYNPNFTKNLDDPGLRIKDNCWGAKLGLNINKLVER